MINNEANNYYYFALKNLLELNSLGWLQGKKEEIINNNDNNSNFQNALDDALNYQAIETHPQRISKLKPYIKLIIITGKRQIFQQDQKNGKNLSEIIRQLRLKYYLYHEIQK